MRAQALRCPFLRPSPPARRRLFRDRPRRGRLSPLRQHPSVARCRCCRHYRKRRRLDWRRLPHPPWLSGPAFAGVGSRDTVSWMRGSWAAASRRPRGDPDGAAANIGACRCNAAANASIVSVHSFGRNRGRTWSERRGFPTVAATATSRRRPSPARDRRGGNAGSRNSIWQPRRRPAMPWGQPDSGFHWKIFSFSAILKMCDAGTGTRLLNASEPTT